MIEMPRRSVTRYFIPLIDVLLLLFCVFLLLPMVNEEELERKSQSAADLTEVVATLEREVERLQQELNRFESLRPELVHLEKLKEEIERLRREKKQALQRAYIQVIDVGAKGDIFYYDPATGKNLPIANEAAAHKLIDRHLKEAKGQELYYYFLMPRPETGYPTRAQERTYQKWFAKVGHSLKEPQ